MTGPIAPAPEPQKKRQPRFGLSLRALMVVVLAVGGLLGWSARRASIQRRAVAEITRAGGTVQYAHQMTTPGPIGFNANAQPWAPGWLRRWAGDEYFQEPRDVIFYGGSPRPEGTSPDATMEAVAALEGVENLNAIQYPITDVGLARLTALRRLKRLDIMDVEVTDAGLASLGAMPALEVFRARVARGKLSGASLARLGGLTRLKEIEPIGLDPVAPADLAPWRISGRWSGSGSSTAPATTPAWSTSGA